MSSCPFPCAYAEEWYLEYVIELLHPLGVIVPNPCSAVGASVRASRHRRRHDTLYQSRRHERR